MDYFKFLTPFVYLLLILSWAYILIFYVRSLKKEQKYTKLLKILLTILALDAFRTLLESFYFGISYTSQANLIPISFYNFLIKPEIVFIPKIINLFISIVIILIIIKKWLPEITVQQEQIKLENDKHKNDLLKTINHLEITQKELIKQKELFEIMFNTIPEGVVITNTEREIVAANKGMDKTFGYQANEIIGNKTSILYADDSMFNEAGKNVFNKEVKVEDKQYITYYKNKDNIVFPGETFGAKLFDENNNWVGNIGIMRNITERVNYINEIKKSKEKAEESERLKSAFLANMSHEIRTPMNAILGFSELIMNEKLNKVKKKKFHEIINSSGKRLLNLISDIIDISKIEAKQLTLSYTTFNLNNLLENLESQFAINNNTEVVIRTKLALQNNQSFIHSDETRLTQVLSNLIQNALKFTKQGFIEIGYTADEKGIHFSVADSGAGIAQKDLDLIFKRFGQSDNQDYASISGTGLGLSISKGIVTLLGGNICVESEVGKGTTFYFSIPNCIVQESVETNEILIDENSSETTDATILVAEDEITNQMLIEEILDPCPYKLIFVENGKEAVELINSGTKIDVILMDINMPIMNGMEATVTIRKKYPTIPIIALTANAMAEDKNKIIAAGFTEYISKPIAVKTLLNTISINIQNNINEKLNL